MTKTVIPAYASTAFWHLEKALQVLHGRVVRLHSNTWSAKEPNGPKTKNIRAKGTFLILGPSPYEPLPELKLKHRLEVRTFSTALYVENCYADWWVMARPMMYLHIGPTRFASWYEILFCYEEYETTPVFIRKRDSKGPWIVGEGPDSDERRISEKYEPYAHDPRTAEGLWSRDLDFEMLQHQ